MFYSYFSFLISSSACSVVFNFSCSWTHYLTVLAKNLNAEQLCRLGSTLLNVVLSWIVSEDSEVCLLSFEEEGV